MVDVVISYGREQEPMAANVARALEADGYSVWWDHDIPAAAKAVIVIWSPAAVKSEWVRAEADLARSQQKLIQVAVEGTIQKKLPGFEIGTTPSSAPTTGTTGPAKQPALPICVADAPGESKSGQR